MFVRRSFTSCGRLYQKAQTESESHKPAPAAKTQGKGRQTRPQRKGFLNYINGYVSKASDAINFRADDYSGVQEAEWKRTYRLMLKHTRRYRLEAGDDT